MTDAVILAGAVSKGAFVGGALSVLLDAQEHPQGMDVRRIVAASSGALNGAYLAAAVRRGTTANAGRVLRNLWLDEADARSAFAPNARGILRLEGFSSSDKLLALLRREIPSVPGLVPIDFHVAVTSAAGEIRPGEHPAATTFEHLARFEGTDFDDSDRLENVFAAVLASAAFPGVFLPHAMTINGRQVSCFDGGLCNNSPVKHALGDPSVTRIFVISSYPRIASPTGADQRGVGLLAHVAEILVNERLYRDLREAREVNDGLAELEANITSPTLLSLVLGAIGWAGRRKVEIVEVRPSAPLAGNAFAGFFSRAQREEYVRAGELAARAALAELYP